VPNIATRKIVLTTSGCWRRYLAVARSAPGSRRAGGAGRRSDGRSRSRPLVVYPAPSLSRTEIRRALNRARLPFRSVCVCRGVNGLIAAVAAGTGISALAASLVPAQLTTLGPGHRLPELGTIDLVLLTNPRTGQRPAVRALISTVLASGSRSLTAYRDEITGPPPPTPHP
jgi:DNA-binding transcriptional LysR family regulator